MKDNKLIFNKKILLDANKLYDKALKFLIIELNKTNNQNLNRKQLQVFIGHWLFSFTKVFLKSYYSKEIINLKIKKKLVIPKNSYSDYINIVSNDEWQKNFISQIRWLKKNNNISIKMIEIYESKNTKSLYKLILYKLHDVFCTLLKTYFLNKKIFIYNSYLGKLNDILLQIKFKELPILFFSYPSYSCEINKTVRLKNLNKNFNKENKLTKIYLKTLLINIPVNFLEGFNIVNNYLEKSFLPKKLKFIFNSNEIITNDYFKIWITKQKSHCKLILSQHGLNYRITNNHFPQMSTIETSYLDKILFWGKRMKKKKNYINMLMIQKKKFFVKNKKNLILVLNQSFPNTHYFDNDKYFLKSFEINNFINGLNDEIKKTLLIRLHKINFEPLTTKKIIKLINSNKNKKTIKIDDGKKNIAKLIQNSKLLIFTYPSSGFLEAISQNIPSILLWKNLKNECLNSALNDFKNLKNKNIVFTDQKKLLKFLNTNWNLIDEWWDNKASKKVVTNFSLKYCTFEDKQFFKVYSKIKSFIKI